MGNVIAPAAFRATVHGLRTVPTRKVCQLTLEFPIEELSRVAAIAEHGAWVAVARLNMESDTPAQLPPPKAEVKPRKKFESLPYPQQAGMCCAEPEFWAFLRENYPYKVQSEDDATFAIYRICDVESRRDLRPGTLGAEEWLKLFNHYRSRQVAERCGAI